MFPIRAEKNFLMYSKQTPASVQAWWTPHSLRQFPQYQSLGEYNPGTYPVPFWKYGAPACALTPRRKGMKPRVSLGDSVQYDDSNSVADQIAVPSYSSSPSFTNYLEMPIAPPPDPLSISNAPDAALENSIVSAPVPLPGVSASTLLAAAKLPNAPAVVQQAAAQLAAASPVSAALQGSTGGIPNYMLLAGAGLLLVVVLASGGKKR